MTEELATALVGRFGAPVIDPVATSAAQDALNLDTTEPIPDVDECPECKLSFVTVEQGAGLSFPMKVACTCRHCGLAWERLDE